MKLLILLQIFHIVSALRVTPLQKLIHRTDITKNIGRNRLVPLPYKRPEWFEWCQDDYHNHQRKEKQSIDVKVNQRLVWAAKHNYRNLSGYLYSLTY